MLQDKAKIGIELDVDLARKQLDDTKKELSSNTKLTKEELDKARDDEKKKKDKEKERQKVDLAGKLRRIAQFPSRLLASDLPEELISGGAFAIGALTGIPGAGAAAGRGSAFYWKNADNLKVASMFGEAVLKDIPGVGEFAKLIKKAAELGPDANIIREIKSKWEAIGKTVEDITSYFTGAVASGQIPPVEGSKRFISSLYEYNTTIALFNKNKEFVNKEVFAKHGATFLLESIKGIGGGKY